MNDNSTLWSKWIQSIEVLDSSRLRRFTPVHKDLFFAYLGLNKSSKVLDVGCGPGTFTRYLAAYINKPGMICGLDRDEAFIRFASREAKVEKISDLVQYQTGDVYSLPYENDFFDAVTSYTVIEHITNTEKFIREKIRVCKKGGMVSVMGAISPNKTHEQVSGATGRLETLYKKLAIITAVIEKEHHIGSCFKIEDTPAVLQKMGLNNIRIGGFYTPFALSDYRYTPDQKRKIIKAEYLKPLVDFISMLTSEYPDKMSDNTITREETEELAGLHIKKYEKIINDLETGCFEWRLEGSPSLIVSGEK
jgi:ubiquinone/menaquinone biosynthesis C-methylase UbiE